MREHADGRFAAPSAYPRRLAERDSVTIITPHFHASSLSALAVDGAGGQSDFCTPNSSGAPEPQHRAHCHVPSLRQGAKVIRVIFHRLRTGRQRLCRVFHRPNALSPPPLAEQSRIRALLRGHGGERGKLTEIPRLHGRINYLSPAEQGRRGETPP